MVDGNEDAFDTSENTKRKSRTEKDINTFSRLLNDARILVHLCDR